MTHTALLDCRSVDTSVGGLYNFISGSNGTRAIPFFKNFVAALRQAPLPDTGTVPMSLFSMSTALCEMLNRERRAIFNEDLPSVVDSIENMA